MYLIWLARSGRLEISINIQVRNMCGVSWPTRRVWWVYRVILCYFWKFLTFSWFCAGDVLQLKCVTGSLHLLWHNIVVAWWHVPIHASTSFQKSPGVPYTPEQVPPPQDCCAFWLVPMCITEESHDRLQTSAVHITILASLGGCQLKQCRQHTSRICLGCKLSHQVWLWTRVLSHQRVYQWP